MTHRITPDERRELRTVVKGQFKVLRAEVKRREHELTAEVERELLERHREEDQAVAEANREVQEIIREAVRQVEAVGRALQETFPDLKVEAGMSYRGLSISAHNQKRTEIHRAAIAAIPDLIGDANLSLDRQEVDLLRQLSEGAIDSPDARTFLAAIPTVGELVPPARLKQLESGLDGS